MALFDLIRPQWKHSDPARRAEAMRLLEDDRQDVFLAAALDDEHVDVRAAAARRLREEGALRKVLAKAGARATDKSVRDAVSKTLLPLLAARATGATAATDAEAAVWVQEIAGLSGGEKALEEVAVEAAALAVRRAALARLTHAAGVLAVALKEVDGGLAREALARLTREAHVETVAKSAKAREAREAAKARLRAEEEARKPDAAALGRAKLDLLLSAAAKAEAGCADPGPAFDWERAQERIEDAVGEFEALLAEGVQASAAERAQFTAHVAVFRDRHAAHVAAEAARRARDEEEARARAAREDVCSRLEALYADPRPVDAADLDALTRAWREVDGGGHDVLEERFRIARERVAARLRAQREAADAGREAERSAEKAGRDARSEQARAEEAERLKTARAAAGPGLEAVIAELETLVTSVDPKTGDKRLRELTAKGKSLLAVLGDEAQGAALRYHAAADRLRETLEWSRWANLQRKQALIEQLEALQQTVKTLPADASETASANADATRPLFARFKELLGEWKAVGPVSWDATEATWDRYHAVADSLYETFRGYFAELDEEREANFRAKDELVTKLEALLASPEAESRETSEAFREAHGAWKALGAVPREKREQADALWERFRAVNKAFQEKRDGLFKDNLAAKRELLARAEELKDSTAWKKTGEAIKELQEQWKAIGPVPRDKAESLWARFHAACETFFNARRAFYEQLDAERPANLEKKTALCERMEKLDELPDDRARYEAILDAQAQWKETGSVPREQEDALWERFRKPIDAYFEAHRERSAAERALRDAGAKTKEALCAEAEALKDSTDRRTAAAFKDLQARWKDSPPAPRHLDRALWTRFRAACDAYFERLKAESAARDGDQEGNLRRKEDLCFAVEIMAGLPAPDEDARLAREAWVEAQLSSGRGAPTAPESAAEWHQATGKVKALQQEWRNIGHVPREESDAIWTRFRKACDAFFEAQRQAFAPAEEDPQRHLEEKLALIAEAEELAHRAGLANLPVVQDLQRRWKRAGAVPRAQIDYVNERFQKACDAALAG